MEAIARLVYGFLDFCIRFFPTSSQKGTLAIIRLDELGDYVLFRNAMLLFTESEHRKGFSKIIFIGNGAWKNLFENLDAEQADETFWIDKKKFQKSLSYRWKTLRRLRKLGVETVLNTHYTKQRDLDISVMKALKAKNRIGFSGSKAQLFTTLIPTEKSPDLFEFYRNFSFFQNWLKRSPTRIPLSNPIVLVERKQTPFEEVLPSKFIAIFPGAGRADKRWPPQNFARVAQYCLDHFNLPAVLMGSPADMPDAQLVMESNIPQMTDLTGKTSITDSLYILQKATAVLSVDTGSVHLAAALEKPVVALYSGKHYGRFAPYPADWTSPFTTLYSPEVLEIIARKDPQLYEEKAMPNERIRDISVETVWAALREILSKKAVS